MNPASSNRQLLYKINLAQRLLMKHVDRHLKESAGVTATQAAALIYLNENQGASMADLSKELFQNKSAITTLVDRMERNGLIEKKASATDKRASQLFVIERGQYVYKQALSAVEEYNRMIALRFSETDIEVIENFLNTIIQEYQTTPSSFLLSSNE